jgi:hypothetical protein
MEDELGWGNIVSLAGGRQAVGNVYYVNTYAKKDCTFS